MDDPQHDHREAGGDTGVDELTGALRRADSDRERLAARLRESEALRLAAEERLGAAIADARRLKRHIRRLKAKHRGEMAQGRRAMLALGRATRDLDRIADSRLWRATHRLAGLVPRTERGEDPVRFVRRELAQALAEPDQAPQPSGSRAPDAAGPEPDQADPPGAAPPPRAGPHPPAPTIVIPVFDQPDRVRTCLASVIANTPADVPVTVIDDASSDPATRPALERVAAQHPRIELLVNPRNLGYTASINRGCRRAPHDVVLLNSDTQVTEGWLEGLAAVAAGRPDVATVTPVSNAAGAFSVPEAGVNADLAPHVSAAEMAQLVRRLSDRLRPQAPTGNGFCMYVRRQAFDAIGYFDEDSFPRGYGEENDFCQRAAEAGLVNLIDDATFVRHDRAASFGDERQALLRQAKARLAERHPGYRPAVERFLRDDPLVRLRGALGATLAGGRQAVENALGPKPTVVYLLHAAEGGVPHTTADLVSSISHRYRCLVLRCGHRRWALEDHDRGGAVIEDLAFPDDWEPAAPTSTERLEALQRLCREHDVELAHIRSLIATGPEVVPALREAGVRTVLSLHDYYTVCPTIHLLDHDGRYCAGHCTPGDGDCPTMERWIHGLPPLKHRYVHTWRERMAANLRSCDAYVVTSHSARSVLADHFPFLGDDRLRVIPHGRDHRSHHPVARPPGQAPVRVACLGVGSASKGLELVRELARLDQADGRRFEFHLLGAKPSRALPEAGTRVHGPYAREDLPNLLAAIEPSFALLPSVWAETWSHTLTEAWMAGIPVFASGLGALGERIERHGGGWLVDQTDPQACHRLMTRVAADIEDWSARRAEIEAMAPRTVDEMAHDYRQLYAQLLSRERSAPVTLGTGTSAAT